MTLDDIRARCYVERETGCWHWLGMMVRGIPCIFLGRVNGKRMQRPARHVTWELHRNKRVKAGMSAMPRCQSADCINPEHVELMTHSEVRRRANQGKRRHADRVARLARAMQEKAGKLNWDKVREIRRRAAAGEYCKTLAQEMGVSTQRVSEIVRNLAWREANPWTI